MTLDRTEAQHKEVQLIEFVERFSKQLQCPARAAANAVGRAPTHEGESYTLAEALNAKRASVAVRKIGF